VKLELASNNETLEIPHTAFIVYSRWAVACCVSNN